jgi:hypothetical protein
MTTRTKKKIKRVNVSELMRRQNKILPWCPDCEFDLYTRETFCSCGKYDTPSDEKSPDGVAVLSRSDGT